MRGLGRAHSPKRAQELLGPFVMARGAAGVCSGRAAIQRDSAAPGDIVVRGRARGVRAAGGAAAGVCARAGVFCSHAPSHARGRFSCAARSRAARALGRPARRISRRPCGGCDGAEPPLETSRESQLLPAHFWLACPFFCPLGFFGGRQACCVCRAPCAARRNRRPVRRAGPGARAWPDTDGRACARTRDAPRPPPVPKRALVGVTGGQTALV